MLLAPGRQIAGQYGHAHRVPVSELHGYPEFAPARAAAAGVPLEIHNGRSGPPAGARVTEALDYGAPATTKT